MMPGRTLHRLASLICDAKSLERVVEPAIADLQKEHALCPESKPRRVWILARAYASVWTVIAITAFTSTTADERRMLAGVHVWALCAATCVAALLVALTVSQIFDIDPRAFRLLHLALAVPSTLPVAVPIGLALGIGFGLRNAAPSRSTRNALLATSFAAAILSFSTMEWVMPDANQAFRQAMVNARNSRLEVARGFNEMGLSTLRHEAQRASVMRHPGQMRRLTWQYHVRRALPLAAPLLTLFAFALIDRRASLSLALIACACIAYFGLTMFSLVLVFELPLVPPIVSAWLTNILFGAAIMLVVSSRSSGLRDSTVLTT